MRKLNKIILIPARSGSKRIKNKNVKKINGKPLIYYTIKQALKIKNIDHVIVSTDSKRYAKIAKKYGAKIFYLRPKNISADNSSDLELFKYNEMWLNKNINYTTDIYVHLRPTFPNRKISDINQMISILEKKFNKIDSIRSVLEVDEKIEKYYNLNKHGYLESELGMRRFGKDKDFKFNQSDNVLKKWFKGNGNIDVFFARNLKKNSVSGSRILGYIQNNKTNLDINNRRELKINSKLLLRKYESTPTKFLFNKARNRFSQSRKKI